MKRLTCNVLIASMLTSCFPAAWADSTASADVVRGNVMVKNAGGNWQAGSEFKPGSWVKAADSDATVNVGGVMMRMTQGSSAYLASVAPGSVSVKMGEGEGRVYVSVPQGTAMHLDAGTQQVDAHSGQFVVRYGAKSDLEVFSGDAKGSKAPGHAPSALAWASDAELALAGPDTQRRPTNQVEGQNNQGQNVGEEATMTPTTTPTETWTPASPTFTPTFTPTVTPTTGRTAVVEDDFPWWAVAAGAIGLGVGLYFLLDEDDDDEVFFVVSP